jgi:hypothetical protein
MTTFNKPSSPRAKNTKHAEKEGIRPKAKEYDFAALEDVVRQWAQSGK